MNENAGGAAAELSAAQGAFTSFSPADFFLVGDNDPRAIELGDGIFAPEPIPGDSDQDGDVDIVDLNNVRNQFGESGQGVLGDANGSGVVDVLDLNLVRANFGTRKVDGVSVPESGSWWLLWIGCSSASVFRRRVAAR